MSKITDTLLVATQWVVELIVAIFNALFPSPKTPVIESFFPTEGWPGTILTIQGKRFKLQRDENIVTIGGDRALILEASVTEVRILAGENTVTGPITVKTSDGEGVSTASFKVLPVPDTSDLSQPGPPVFFHGPQHGTPKLGKTDQKVLVILCHTSDLPAAPQDEKKIIKAFEDANRYWSEASYNKTSWKFDYTSWIKLDHSRDDYVWQREDIDRALRDLLEKTKHGAAVRAELYAGYDLNRLSVVKIPGDPTKLKEVSDVTLIGEATAVHIVDKRAYVTAGKAGLYIFDISSSPPTKLKRLTSNHWLCDVDSAAKLLVAAALDGGALIYDIAIPLNPQLKYTFTPANKGWVTAVKMVGNKLILGLYEFKLIKGLYGYENEIRPRYFLQMLDLSNPANPVPLLPAVEVGAYVMDIDVNGSLCVVATDGAGLGIFDVGGSTIAKLSDPVENLAYLQSVALDNKMAYIAAGASGFQIIDLSDPKNPKIRGSLATAKEAYHVTVAYDRAYLLLGARQVAVVDISDVDKPTIMADIQLGAFASSSLGYDPDLATLRQNVQEAINLQATAHHFHTLLGDVIKKALIHHSPNILTTDKNHPDYCTGFIALLNGPFLRGQSFKSDTLTTMPGGSFYLNEEKGLIYLAKSGTDWSRIAHEIGHWFTMPDIYAEAYANGTLLQGTAAPWCMSGGGWELFCGYQIHEKMHFYEVQPEKKDETYPNCKRKGNIIECEWSATAPAMDKTFRIVAHSANEISVSDERVHLVKLIVSAELWYYIEVRQKQDGNKLIFDQFDPKLHGYAVKDFPKYYDKVPLLNVGDSAVVVTRAMKATSVTNNSSEQAVMLFGKKSPPPDSVPDKLPLTQIGDKVVDAARGLSIEVTGIHPGDPVSYDVNIKWNQPVTDDPTGQFNLSITQWSTDTWDTPDIWVDRDNNNTGGVIKYDKHEPGDDTKPILNGDKPWVGHENAIYVRICNDGPVAVNDVYVTFYATSPPGIGDNGDWATLGTDQIKSIPGFGQAMAQYKWVPKAGEHTCLKVSILPREGERFVGDNDAQENVFDFESPGGSSHRPVVVEAQVRSPFTIWRRVDMRVRDLPAGWHAVVNHNWVWTSPKGTQPVTAVIWTDLNAPYSFTPDDILLTFEDEWEVPKEALARVEGWTSFDHRYVPIGGILADVKATIEVVVECEFGADGQYLFGHGCLIPGLPDIPITIEVVDSNNHSHLYNLTTDSQGCFDLTTLKQNNPGSLQLAPDTYTVRVYVTPGGEAAETECEPVQVKISE